MTLALADEHAPGVAMKRTPHTQGEPELVIDHRRPTEQPHEAGSETLRPPPPSLSELHLTTNSSM